MKKFLSIKNTQGIYVARASFSSDETVIDFVNSEHSDHSITNPVSIVVTPDEFTPTLTTSKNATAYDSISVQTQSKSSGKKKFKARLLKFLHIKRKAKMADDATQERSDEPLSASGSHPMLPTPKMSRAKVSKSRTAELVKKFTLTPKKSPPPPPPPQVLIRKKSLIPLRTATSVEALSNAPQSVLKNRIETRTTVNHHSISEMNLVNIDYRQENANMDDGFGVGDQIPRYANWSGNETNRNMSIRSETDEGIESSNSKMVSGRKSTSTEKLQITISGKKRELKLSDIESKKIERKPSTMQQPLKKLNINHDLTLMNTIGVPPAQTTQAPFAIPTTYRTAPTTASMKKIIQSRTAIKAQSTMQLEQSVDASASAVNVERMKNAPKRADTLVTVTSFDVEDPDDLVAASERKLSSTEKDTASLLTEIIEAERRNSLTMESERGHRFPSAATSENTEFSHQPSTSTTTIDQKMKRSGPEIIPKVVIEEVASSPIENPVKLGKREKSKKIENSEKIQKSERASDKRFDVDIDKDSELISASVHAGDIEMAPEVNDEDNELSTTSQSSQPTLQFEVGKQVRPIFPTNHNLHLNIYSALDNSSATTFSSILTTNSFVEMHNSELFSNLHSEPMSAPIMSVSDEELLNVDDHHKLSQIRSQQRRRRIVAYLETSKQSGSPSTSNRTIDMESNDMFTYGSRLDSTLLQFSNLRTQISAVITDRLMPPYGDLVWDDDGVNEPNAIVLVIYL